MTSVVEVAALTYEGWVAVLTFEGWVAVLNYEGWIVFGREGVSVRETAEPLTSSDR